MNYLKIVFVIQDEEVQMIDNQSIHFQNGFMWIIVMIELDEHAPKQQHEEYGEDNPNRKTDRWDMLDHLNSLIILFLDENVVWEE